LPNTAGTQQLFNACQAQGGKAWDHSALVRALELLAQRQVAQLPVAQDSTGSAGG
jgi:2-hydroxy-3-oxopropionate reductase